MNKRAISNPGASFLLLSLVTAAFLVFAGCGTLREVRNNPLPVTTNTVATVIEIPAVTNIVVSPDGAGTIEVVTPAKTITNWQTNIVVDVNPVITSTINTARGANSMLNLTPSAPVINLGLAALSGVLGIVAAWKQKRLQRAQDRAAASNDMLEAVIAGVEVAKDPKTKATITEISTLWGNSDELKSKVHQVTNKVTV